MKVRQTRLSTKYQIIWDTVRHVPKGNVATYGEVATVSGLVGQARLVGYALHSVPPGVKIPWHRVINSQGKISLPKSNGQYKRQKKLLEKEGIVFRKGKIDLSKYSWLRTMNKR